MSSLIGIAGLSGVGKDTCADILVSERAYEKHAFATPLKQYCQQLFLLSNDQVFGNQAMKNAVDLRYNLSPREILQKFGTDFIRNMISETFWIDRFRNWYSDKENDDQKKVVVCDVRFVNEAEMIKSLGGRLIHISRPGLSDYPGMDHVSEQLLPSCEHLFDEFLMNDGDVEDLRKGILNIIDDSERTKHNSSLSV